MMLAFNVVSLIARYLSLSREHVRDIPARPQPSANSEIDEKNVGVDRMRSIGETVHDPANHAGLPLMAVVFVFEEGMEGGGVVRL